MDVLRECFSKYWECTKLMEVESKNDPETEPYLSKYKAITILLEVKDLMTKSMENLTTNDLECHLFRVVLTAVLGRIGIAYSETEELFKAEEYFKNCLASIPYHLHPDFVILSIQARNQLGLLYSDRSEPIEAKKWLEGSEKLYEDFKACKDRVTRSFRDLLADGENTEGEKELETSHTFTKFLLAQVYGTLKDVLKSAIYCHQTLRRQLMFKEYDPIEWALNSATLSQVFMEKILLKQAKHHLAAASHVLDCYEEKLKGTQGPPEEMYAKKEEFRHRSSDVSRCWAKYGTFLLEYSRNLLSNAPETAIERKNENLENLWFDSLDLMLYENQITDSYVVTFEDAREVFLITQKHLNKAKEYYTLEDRASDHVQIVQNHSQLFKNLAAFEPNEERQFKMMKKRVNMLEVVVRELNPRYYLNVCRQLWFELGEIYHDMMQINFEKIKGSSEIPRPAALMKINALIENSITNFNNVLSSIKDKKSKELPDPLPDDLIGLVLIAHFYLGRLYHQYITQDKQKQKENTTKAYEYFKYFVDSCEKSEKAKNIVGEELSVSKEMMTLLQLKILQL